MKRGLLPKGFTVVEVLIFLAVSGALAVSAMLFVSGMQNKTQFNQASNDFLQQVDMTINNTTNGYYAGSDNIKCQRDPSGNIKITDTLTKRGTNADCIFLGRAIKLDLNSDTYTIYDIAGLRKTGSNKEVTSLAEARPTLIEQTKQEYVYRNGLKLKKITENYDYVGFFGSLAQVSASGDIQSSSQQTDFAGFNNLSTLTMNPSEGVELCLDDGQYFAKILIGGNDRKATTSMTSGKGVCS
ncbi:type II secretion system protein [Candidatus Saccharibacteria bacterium]|nr:type II secretion system protein [Candidatus Saccharibacteria bacterium]